MTEDVEVGDSTIWVRPYHHANEGIWTLDANNLTVYINERGASMLGYE